MKKLNEKFFIFTNENNKLKVNLTIYTTKNALNYSKNFCKNPLLPERIFIVFFYFLFNNFLYIFFNVFLI